MQFWLMAIVCGLAQVVQAVTNGSAARSGLGAIWTGAMSATMSVLTLLVMALVVYPAASPG